MKLTKEITVTIIGVIITCFACIGTYLAVPQVQVFLQNLLARDRSPQIYSLDVSASTFPFASTNINLKQGDILSISVESAILWNCGLDDVTAFGVTDPEKQRTALLRSANFCAIIGYMDDSSYFKIEIGKEFQVPASGILYLGANDASPDFCSKPEGCFTDNKGTLKVKIIVEGKK